MKVAGKILLGVGCVAAVGALACYGLKKLMEKAAVECKCCDCGDECTCDCECECHDKVAETDKTETEPAVEVSVEEPSVEEVSDVE